MTATENPFQAGTRKVIPAVLIYARRGGKILMIQKLEKNTEKWNGLGGKCEVDESVLQAAKREFKEEAGVDLSLEAFNPLGVIQFPNFKPKRSEDWLVSVFEVEYLADFSEPQKSCDEGTLHWIEEERLLTLPLWDGDRHFLSYVLKHRPFIGTFWYQDQKLKDFWIQEFVNPRK